MQLIADDSNSVEMEQDSLLERIKRENIFISGILNSLQNVQRYADDDAVNSSDDEDSGVEDEEQSSSHMDSAQAQTVQELQQRLKELQGNRSEKMSFRDRMLKKGYQDRLKKKKKLLQRKEHAKGKSNLVKQQKLINSQSETTEKKPKPVFNSEGKMVFSKFDFSVNGASNEGPSQKGPKDPKKLLEKIKSREERLAKIAESGNVEKLVEIKKKDAWQNALKKAEGIKVKDDPELLKKTIKKKEKKKKQSAERWAARVNATKKSMEERQKKRQSNIQAKSEMKKKKKQKQLIKRGRIIPGLT